ncbi:MAG: type II toxin-antitoxin system RatA family toxin [Hyphomicrobiaceae bacterium]|nr:type II toxin-antitoxin system RatA family toxin [Hyphomicrobiaceae bacterium]
MPSFSNRRTLAFSPGQIFDLVADIERYPEFLPLCESLRITDRKTLTDRTVLTARMGIGYKAIREHFTTRVTLIPGENRIVVEYVDGPFRHLENRWRFLPHPQGCEIDFFITYEFRSVMLGLLMGAMFDKAFRKFSEAFENRARQIYGRPHGHGTAAVPT